MKEEFEAVDREEDPLKNSNIEISRGSGKKKIL